LFGGLVNTIFCHFSQILALRRLTLQTNRYSTLKNNIPDPELSNLEMEVTTQDARAGIQFKLYATGPRSALKATIVMVGKLDGRKILRTKNLPGKGSEETSWQQSIFNEIGKLYPIQVWNPYWGLNLQPSVIKLKQRQPVVDPSLSIK
jgi:hypothetical protein